MSQMSRVNQRPRVVDQPAEIVGPDAGVKPNDTICHAYQCHAVEEIRGDFYVVFDSINHFRRKDHEKPRKIKKSWQPLPKHPI